MAPSTWRAVEVQPVIVNQQVVDVVGEQKNKATELIEDFMIAANEVVARSLEKVSSLRRIVKTPEHWDRIVQIAALHGETLPAQPDSKALNDFLLRRKAADPDYFAALSLAVIKLIGPGEYVLERPGDPEAGHFGLAVQDYTHSTAPNRRFADLVTQRLIKALLAGQSNPYSDEELAAIASNCTLKEDAAQKVERQMAKRLAAAAMSRRIGAIFDAVVETVNPNLRAGAETARRRDVDPGSAGHQARRQVPREAAPCRYSAWIPRFRSGLETLVL